MPTRSLMPMLIMPKLVLFSHLRIAHALHVANFWVLVPGRDCHTAPTATADVCRRLMVAAHMEEDYREVMLEGLLDEVSEHAVSIELSSQPDWFERASSEPGELDRHFRLPAGMPTSVVREMAFQDGGLGHHVWDASIGMSIWLARNTACYTGKRVLELGSGVGLCGMSAKLCGASSVVLSDYFGQDSSASTAIDEDLPSPQIIENLEYNTRANGLADSVEASTLDWTRCLSATFEPSERFQVVIGTDLIYDRIDPAALAATVVAHTAVDGVCYLMSTYREGCSALGELHHLLRESGSLAVEDFSVVNEYGVTPRLELSTFRPGRR